MEERTVIIGDVHGCLAELDQLLDQLRLGERDKLIFLGDLINKGPDGVGVLRRVRELKAVSLLGNHEARLLRYRRTAKEKFLKKGDLETMAAMTLEDWDLLESMELTIELPEYNTVTVHGGFLPHIPWRQQTTEVVTRIQVIDEHGQAGKRSDSPGGKDWGELWTGPEYVVYGHTPQRDVIRHPFSIGIDTGCVYGGHLTAMIFPQRELCQVKAIRAYRP